MMRYIMVSYVIFIYQPHYFEILFGFYIFFLGPDVTMEMNKNILDE